MPTNGARSDAAVHLLSRLVRLATGADLSPATLSVPLGLGFLCTAQITALRSGFDPLVALPVYGGLQTMLGLVYLAAATRALTRTDSRVSIAGASLLGVLGFLTYDGFVVYVATVVVIAWVFRRSWDSGTGRTRWALAWLVLPPLATLLVSRLVVATHDVGYAGTEWGADPLITPAAWLTSLHTAAPAATWGVAAEHVDLRGIAPYGLAAGLVAGACFVAWALIDQATKAAGQDQPTRLTARPMLLTLAPVVALAALAPVPFVVAPPSGASTS